MSLALSSAKLHTPLLRQNVVARIRLIGKLDLGLHRTTRLILVSAPAGFGKTTLLVEWLHSASGPSVVDSKFGFKSAWVSLDEADNDPVRFWTYVILALQSIHDEFGEATLASLRSPQPLPVETVPALLIEEMSGLPHGKIPIVVVLEDYHVINNPQIHTTLAFLLEHLPSPQTLCVAMCTRSDPPIPLARLRAHEELIEIRADDLRFSSDEATLFLRQCEELEPAPEEVAILLDKTEGWIAGLQMAALSVQGRTDTLRFIQAFSGTDRFVLDYLVEQVLERQPESVQEFLLETSVLEQLSGPLCDAVTGQSGSQALLEGLERANLFLVPLDDKRQWYRYHHLFRDLLYARLKQRRGDALRTLHTRAAEWYEQNELTSEAIHHSEAAGDFDTAAQLIEHNAPSAVLRGEIATVIAWIGTLPAELVRYRPWLSIYHAWALAFAGQTERVESMLRAAELEARRRRGESQGSSETESMLGQIASLRAYTALLGGNVSMASEQASLAHKRLPACDLMTRGTITFVLADTYQIVGDLPRACETLSEVIQIARSMDNLYLTINGMLELAYLRKVRGQLHQAQALYQEVLEMESELGGPHFPLLGSAKVGMGDLWREWNDLPSATQWINEGVEYNRRRGSPNFLAQSYLALGRVLQAQGDLESAFDALDKAEQLIQKYRVSLRAVSAAKALRIRLFLARADLASALGWIRENPDGGQEDELSYVQEPYTIARARVLLAQAKPDQAMHLLTRVGEAAQAGGRMGTLIEILALQALAWRAQNDLPRALAVLERAVMLAQSEGYVRLFVDEGSPMTDLLQRLESGCKSGDSRPGVKILEYISRLLNAFGSAENVRSTTIRAEPFVEPLSDRELQVLRLLAEGLSNRVIAEKLTIAIGTVKAHVHSIYGKLGAENRVQAIASARELGLL